MPSLRSLQSPILYFRSAQRPQYSPRLRHFQCPHRPRSRALHLSSAHLKPQTHYDTLSLSPSAAPGDVKKQFYSLSKKYHPDLNPHNPSASERFVAISEAYATLGDSTKRAKYDREHLPSQRADSSGAPSGSYHSSGGRTASGLSRRRTPFKGPPPSFYQAGGWGAGANAAKRAQAQNAYANSAAASGKEEGRKDWPFNDINDVLHWDRDGHFKQTTSVEEQLRQGRRKRRKVVQEDAEDEMMHGVGAGDFKSFLVIGGVMIVGLAPLLLFRTGKKEKQ